MKYVYVLLMLFITVNGYSQEIITDLSNDGLPFVNEEFRKLRDDIKSLETSVAANTAAISALTFDAKHYIMGLELEYDNDTSLNVKAGALEVDGEILVSTADTAVSLGDTPTDGWNYIYAYDNTTIAFYVSTSAPDKHDADGNTDGTLYYLISGSTEYRCIGAVYVSSNVINQFYQIDNYVQFDTFLLIKSGTTTSSTWQTFTTTYIPAISTCGYFELLSQNDGTNFPLIYIRPYGSANTISFLSENLWRPAVGYEQTVYCKCFTGSAQQVDIKMVVPGGTGTVKTVGFYLNIR